MKTCACCAALAASAEPTCAQCGEASWIECADDRALVDESASGAFAGVDMGSPIGDVHVVSTPKRKGGR